MDPGRWRASVVELRFTIGYAGNPGVVADPSAPTALPGQRRVPTGERALTLACTPAAPVEARRLVAGIPGMGGALGYKTLLLVSEAVTAAVLAAETSAGIAIELRASVNGERVRVDVVATEPSERGPDIRLSGYAERIFRRTASRWGIERDGDTRVWFELDR